MQTLCIAVILRFSLFVETERRKYTVIENMQRDANASATAWVYMFLNVHGPSGMVFGIVF